MLGVELAAPGEHGEGVGELAPPLRLGGERHPVAFHQLGHRPQRAITQVGETVLHAEAIDEVRFGGIELGEVRFDARQLALGNPERGCQALEELSLPRRAPAIRERAEHDLFQDERAGPRAANLRRDRLGRAGSPQRFAYLAGDVEREPQCLELTHDRSPGRRAQRLIGTGKQQQRLRQSCPLAVSKTA